MVFVRLVTTKIINRRCNGKSNLRFYGADVSLCRFHDAPDPIFNGPLSDKSPIFSSVSPCVWLCRRRQLFPWMVYFFHDSRKRGRRMAGGVLWKFLINVLARVSPWRHIASWAASFRIFPAAVIPLTNIAICASTLNLCGENAICLFPRNIICSLYGLVLKVLLAFFYKKPNG